MEIHRIYLHLSEYMLSIVRCVLYSSLIFTVKTYFKDLSFPTLAVALPSLIIELLVISSHWLHESMQELCLELLLLWRMLPRQLQLLLLHSSRETMEEDKN